MPIISGFPQARFPRGEVCMKRARRIAIALVLALVLQTVTGFLGTSSVNAVLAYAAPYQIEGTVTVGILNVRKGAGTKYDCIGTLTKGQKVTIIGTATAGNGVVWYKIEATISGKKVTGYSTSNYISAKSIVPGTTGTKTAATPTPTKGTAKPTPLPTTKAATPTPTQAAKTSGGSSGRVAIVNVTRMNVRKGATTSSDVLGKAYSGDRLPILGSAKDSSGYIWYLVEITLNGKLTKGYVYGNYVTVTTAEKTPTPMPTATPTTKPTPTKGVTPKPTATPAQKNSTGQKTGSVAVVTATRMNVRKSASTASDVLGKVYQNDRLPVLGTAKDSSGRTWYQVEVKFGGVTKTGYVFGSYVSITSGSVTATPTPKATPTPTPKPADTKNTTSKDASVDSKGKIPTPTPTPSKPSVSGTEATVTSSTLNIRTGPGTEYAKVVTVSKGQKVTVVSYAYSEDGYVWYDGALIVNGMEYRGYMFGDYISLSKDFPLTEKNNSGTLQKTSVPKTDTKDSYADTLRKAGFPESYIPYLLELHKQHPTWTFKAYQTGLDWEKAVKGENTLGNNLIELNKGTNWLSYATGSYNWRTGRFQSFDGKEWMMINSAGLQYFMDPRNWLDDTYVFMFEDLTYDPATQTIDGVKKILKGTVMDGASFTYTDENGKEKTISYAQAFMDAAKYSGVSPYHLASRVKQEVTSGGAFSKSATGNVEGFEGYYNFYNIGAYNSTAALGAIRNGLKYAKYGGTSASLNAKCKIPWDNRYDAIVGGAYYIGSTYIQKGQNTIYLQKYNVTGTNTYSHQYMSNAQAPRSEAYKVAQAYRRIGAIDEMPLTFTIPVYRNMPSGVAAEPKNVGSPNPYLSSISLKTDSGTAVSLSSSFQQDVFEYTVTVPSGTKLLTVSAKAVISGTKILGVGTQTLRGKDDTIVVTAVAENGSRMNYRITVKYR